MQEHAQDIHGYVYSVELVELVKAANEAAGYLEGLKGKETREFLDEIPLYLTGVYAAMLRVGETDPVFETSAEPVVTEQDWSAVYQQVARILGENNEFLRPAGEEEFDRSELVPHTISEDLADIYQELRDFATNYSRGLEEIMNDAAWELKQRFTEQWGKKLLRALLALHELTVSRTDSSDA